MAGTGTLYRLDLSDFHAVVNLGCLDVGVQLCVQRHAAFKGNMSPVGLLRHWTANWNISSQSINALGHCETTVEAYANTEW